MPAKVASESVDGIGAQVRRLANINQRTQYDLREHQRVIQKNARTWEHAEAIITRIVDECTDLPSPAEVAVICGQVPVPGEPTPTAECRKCNGSGWVFAPRVVAGVTYDASERCGCRGGGR